MWENVEEPSLHQGRKWPDHYGSLSLCHAVTDPALAKLLLK
jgi:hypothetical protein